MHGNVPADAAKAISISPGSGIDLIPEAGANPESGIGADDDWFFNVAQQVFGKKETGLHLHYATGWPRTSCYAFVAREPDQRRKPPSEFLRILFRSDHGKPFHDAFMAGCAASWYRDEQRAKFVGEQVLAITQKP